MKSSLIITLVLNAILFLSCNSQKPILYEEGFINVADEVDIYYEKFGNGPEHILFPGGMYYSPIFKQLAHQNRTLILYDQRARGQSSSISDSTQLGWKFDMSDIEKIRQYFGFEKISIIGWSYTGLMAALYSIENPENVERVIQIGPMTPRKDPYYEQQLKILNTRRDSSYNANIKLVQETFRESGDLSAYIRSFYKIAHQPLLFNKGTKEEFRDDFYSSVNEQPEISFGFTFPAIISSLGNWDVTNKVSNLKMPFLIIHGTYDYIPLDGSKEWNTILPNSKLWIIKDVGHLPFSEKTKEVLQGVDIFLNGKWPEQAKD